MTTPEPFFALPDRLAAKRDPALIDDDEAHFAAIDATLRAQREELQARLTRERRSPGGHGQAALERDLEIHRLSARLRTLERYGVDLCLGRAVEAATGQVRYIGRLGLADAAGRRLLVDWRTPAAEPFFAATHAHPLGLAARRRFRWSGGRVSDYWDESFVGGAATAALDDHSAFIASLGASRSPRMRDVLGTIQADQDAIIRADARGALVVDGGPGTGKTVVALHRAAFLLHEDARIARGGVLVVGPHRPYLAYVADVLPSLGEDSVRLCTLRDLVPEGATAVEEPDPAVAALKADSRMPSAIEALVRERERPPVEEIVVDTDWADLEIGPVEWEEAFAAAEPDMSHDDARDVVWHALVEGLHDRLDGAVPLAALRRRLAADDELAARFREAWPVLDPVAAVAALWSDPALLARCAPWLDAQEVVQLQRAPPVPGPSPTCRCSTPRAGASAIRTPCGCAVAARSKRRASVSAWSASSTSSSPPSSWATARACPPCCLAPMRRSRSRTRARSPSRPPMRWPAPSRTSWSTRRRSSPTPSGACCWRAAPHAASRSSGTVRRPGTASPSSVRRSGVPVRQGSRSELAGILERWLAEHEDGTACVIGDPSFPGDARIRSLTPTLAKGLEFDLVVLVDPDALGDGIEGAVDRYVAMTRSTRELVVLR